MGGDRPTYEELVDLLGTLASHATGMAGYARVPSNKRHVAGYISERKRFMETVERAEDAVRTIKNG